MPRAPGQIDEGKRDAILAAAAEAFAERGFAASLEAVAAKAGVSKQTVYNRFGGREELLRKTIEEGRGHINAALEPKSPDASPEDVLAAYAEAMMRKQVDPRTVSLLRVAIAAAPEHPDMARVLYEAGPRANRARLAEYLRLEHERGRLAIDDPAGAAEFFAGMATGSFIIALALGQPTPTDAESVPARARECARRFVRAYAPV